MSRQQLTPEQAEAMLPDGDYIHTFVTPSPGMLIGCDWKREEVLARFRDKEKQPPELAGAMATGMDHGICIWDERWVFIATKAKEAVPDSHPA